MVERSITMSKWVLPVLLIFILYSVGITIYHYCSTIERSSFVFFFLEDIEDSERADNWSDLVIRMNPISEEKAKNVHSLLCRRSISKTSLL